MKDSLKLFALTGAAFDRRQRCAPGLSALGGETSKKPRIIVEINDNTGFFPSFLSESN
jgi:hypothetical protein